MSLELSEVKDPIAYAQGVLQQAERAREKLLVIEAQLKKDGEHLHQQAEERVAKKAATLAQQETSLMEREHAVSKRESAIGAQEEAARKSQQMYTARLASVNVLEASVQRTSLEQQERTQQLGKVKRDLEAMASSVRAQIEAERTAWNAEKSAQAAREVSDRQRLQRDSTSLAKQLGEAGEKQQQLEALLADAEKDRAARTHLLATQEAERCSREASLSARHDDTKRLAQETEETQRMLRAREEAMAKREADAERMSKSLSKGLLDLEVKEGRVEKLRRMVAALVKKLKLTKDLTSLVTDEELSIVGE